MATDASRMISDFLGDQSITTLNILIACDCYHCQCIVFVHVNCQLIITVNEIQLHLMYEAYLACARRDVMVTNLLSRFRRVFYVIRCCSSVDENIFFDCMRERDEGEGRGCVCLALTVGLVSLQQLFIKHKSVSLSLLGRRLSSNRLCVCLFGEWFDWKSCSVQRIFGKCDLYIIAQTA